MSKQGQAQNVLVDALKPEELVRRLAFSLPEREGLGREGLLETIQQLLRYSVNTWDQGFLDKLYASTNAVSTVAQVIIHEKPTTDTLDRSA